MDIRKIKKLIELLEESGIDELEIHEGEESVRISRHSKQVAAPQYQVAPAPVAAAPAPAAAPAAADAPAAPAEPSSISVGARAPRQPLARRLVELRVCRRVEQSVVEVQHEALARVETLIFQFSPLGANGFCALLMGGLLARAA